MNKIYLLAATLLAASSVQAASIPLTNGGFEAQVLSFGGFDASGADIPGWSNYGTVADGGDEGPGAWWGTYNAGWSAFLVSGTGAYNTSGYTIQSGDVFTVDFAGKTWGGASQIKVTLFFDAPGTPSSPTNVIGSFTTDVVHDWALYSGSIAATAESVGKTLGVIFEKPAGQDVIAWDEVAISSVPEPSTYTAIVGALALGTVAVRRRRRS